MEKMKWLINILKKYKIARIGIVIILSLLFLATISIVNADDIKINTLPYRIIFLEEEVVSGHYFGMVEALNEQLFAYSEDFVHTFVPKPENGHHQIPMVYMDVFIEELRPDHETYMILPYIVYYEIIGPLNWERHDVYCPVTLFIFQDETFNRYHIGTLGFGKGTIKDTIHPFRTGIACFHFVSNQWVKVDSKESDLGWWYLDHYPYNLNYNNGIIKSNS